MFVLINVLHTSLSAHARVQSLGVSPNFEITVACGLKFHWYLRILSLKFQMATSKIEVRTCRLHAILIKFIYSEKATKFCEIFTLLLSYVVPVESKVKISQNFVAFSEYMNFTKSLKKILNWLIYLSIWMRFGLIWKDKNASHVLDRMWKFRS